MACKAKQKLIAQVQLKVNGEDIELNNFARNFISQTVIGMVKSLRGVGEIETVSLKIVGKPK